MTLFGLSSCSNDDSDPQPLPEVPFTYEFMRNGESTVDFSGQLARQNMLTEIDAYFDQALQGTALDGQRLLDMYENNNAPFESEELNGSGKSLSTKTSASPAHEGEQFEAINWFKELLQQAAAASEADEPASEGQAGLITEGERTYLVSGQGVEFKQLFQKGIMGACFMDQAVNNYLTAGKLNVNNETPEEGKNYTLMEHHWDEAYGYFSKVKDYSTDPGQSQDRGYWGRYLVGLETDFQLASLAYEAYRLGRAAITEDLYDLRDEQVGVIREAFETAAAIKAIGYLNKGKISLNGGERAKAFHEWSEGAGFVYSLRFAPSGRVSSQQSAQWLELLTGGEGFWADDITDKADQVKAAIGEAFELSEQIVNGTY